LSAASGNYIYFLDADDLIAPGAMETAYRTARENDLDMLLFGCAPSFESREVRKQQRSLIKYYRQNGSYPGVTGGDAYFNRCIYFSDFVSTVSVQLVKRSFLAENRLGFFDGILHEDNPYTFLCLMYAKRVMRIPDVLFTYRVRAASITTAQKGGAHIAGLLRGIWLITEYETKREADLPAETSAAVNILKEKLLDQAVRAFSGLPPGAEEREADFFPAGDPDIAAMFLLLRKLAKERDREWGRFLAFREKAFRYLRERKRSMT
jgi:glycosyltransferase involved in cell wall biosynthesis